MGKKKLRFGLVFWIAGKKRRLVHKGEKSDAWRGGSRKLEESRRKEGGELTAP